MPDPSPEEKPVIPLSYRDTSNCFERGLVLGSQVLSIMHMVDALDEIKRSDEGVTYINRRNTAYYKDEMKDDVEPIKKAYRELIPKMVDRLVETAKDTTTTICYGFEDTVKYKRFEKRLDQVKEDANFERFGREFKLHLESVLDGGEV